jgi:2,3,4,5-tetrahydropyridine-2-carboxylate N-succinyltransferase
MTDLQQIIDAAFDNRDGVRPDSVDPEVRDAVFEAIELLDRGEARVAEPRDGDWVVNQWLKKAVLLSFRLRDNRLIEGGETNYFDKVPLKYAGCDEATFAAQGVRVVPPATVRKGAYVARNAVLMPCFVNIGAHVGEGTMVDTWASVGSCSQIGAGVHLSAGAGIGGVLEPLQANPTIIEDGCFIGARSEIVEGVRVGAGAVISMGVFIGQSTPIYDRENDRILRGEVPPGAVVVAGSLPRDGGRYSLNCAVIVKQVDAATRKKTGVNELLRDIE